MPCRKYNRHSSRKFLLSRVGSCEKLVLTIAGVGGTGTSLSSVKSPLPINCALAVGESTSCPAFFRRISTCAFMSPLACPLKCSYRFVEILSSGRPGGFSLFFFALRFIPWKNGVSLAARSSSSLLEFSGSSTGLFGVLLFIS